MHERIKENINDIIHFLQEVDSASYFEHMKYLNDLLDLTDTQHETFFEKINSAELWGGSGSLWESEYGMNELQRKDFERLLLSLLEKMKEENILDKRAKSVYRILNSFVN